MLLVGLCEWKITKVRPILTIMFNNNYNNNIDNNNNNNNNINNNNNNTILTGKLHSLGVIFRDRRSCLRLPFTLERIKISKLRFLQNINKIYIK